MSQNIGFRHSEDSRGLRGRRLSRRRGDDTEVNEAASAQRASMFQDARDLSIYGGNMVTAGGPYVNVTFNESAMAAQSTTASHRETPPEYEQLRTSSQQPPSQSACEVYYRNLAVKKRGSPLWMPEPNNNLSLQYRKKGVSIGDVGLLSRWGNFNFFFNICLPQDHPINDGGVPDGFKPINPSVPMRDYSRMRVFKSDSYLASESIQICHSSSHDLTFESSASEGAVLTMPHGAYSEDLITTLQFRKYMTEHVESWYRYLNQIRGCEAQNGDIRLVIGCDKTDAWGMAAHVKSTFQMEAVRLTFQPAGDRSQAYKWEFSGSVETRTGPDADEVAELQEDGDTVEIIVNQCLFLRTMNANLQDDIWERLCAEIYSGMPVQGTSNTYIQSSSIFRNPQSGISFQTQPTMSSIYPTGGGSMRTDTVLATAPRYLSTVSPTAMMAHPSNAINDLLLKRFRQKFPTAKMIITEDNHWVSLMKSDDSILPHPDDLLSRMEVSDIMNRVRMEEDVLFMTETVTESPVLERAKQGVEDDRQAQAEEESYLDNFLKKGFNQMKEMIAQKASEQEMYALKREILAREATLKNHRLQQSSKKTKSYRRRDEIGMEEEVTLEDEGEDIGVDTVRGSDAEKRLVALDDRSGARRRR